LAHTKELQLSPCFQFSPTSTEERGCYE